MSQIRQAFAVHQKYIAMIKAVPFKASGQRNLIKMRSVCRAYEKALEEIGQDASIVADVRMRLAWNDGWMPKQ